MTALVPPFTHETAAAKVRGAEDGWNSRDPQRVSLVYTENSYWRNRAEFIKWPERDHLVPHAQMEQGAGLSADKGTVAFTDNRIAVRFAYEWHDDANNWFRSYGNENWEFDASPA